MTDIAASDQSEASLPRAHFVSVVWGSEFTKKLLMLAWRSLLSQGNLPALRRTLDAVYTIYICEDDMAQLERAPQLARLRELAAVEIVPFSARDIQEDRYSWHHIAWSRAVAKAQEMDDVVFFVIPDMVFFDGTLERWARYIVNGKRAIFTIGTWVVEETFLPEFESRTLDQQVTTVSAAEGMDYLLRHMHPLPAASLLDSQNHLYHMDRISQTVGGSAMVSRVFSSQPLAIDPGHFVLGAGYRPTNRLRDIVMDPICGFSVGSLLHVSEFYYGQSPLADERVYGLASWALENVGRTAALESKFDYIYKLADTKLPDEEFRQVRAALDARTEDILVLGEIAKLWRHALDAGELWTPTLLALANCRFSIFRELRTGVGYTVFMPKDSAFGKNFDETFARFADGSMPVGLVDFIKFHVVPRRLYLQPGTRIILRRTGGNGVRTLGGGHIDVYAPGRPAPPDSVLVPWQRRSDNAIIYPIEKTLIDPNVSIES